MEENPPSTETLALGPSLPPAPAPLGEEALARGAAVGRYLILNRVGRGGMGVVYAAYDPELERKVAVKILRPDRRDEPARRARLLREAQALARLSHPNVIAVHDAGSFGDQVFLAMELAEGRTLRQWLEEEKPAWREILGCFLLAGRGLAAAHAAGLVHRDFKPENVLLGEEGRVRVVDFGLARAQGEAGGETGSGALLASPLTQEGVAMGTPGYMAPEQLRGLAADARSDQFSFCVALYEALHGELPLPGKEPAASRIPGWVRQALFRGLSADPERRYPTMEALLRDLGRDRGAVRRRWLAAAAGVLGIGAVFSSLGYSQAQRARLCEGAEEKLAGIWDAERKGAVRAAFLATGAPFAEVVSRSVGQALDGFARDWTAARREACEATRLRGEQSEDLLDRRMFCLDQRLREVEAMTGVFLRADAKTVEKAADAVSGLADLSHCSRSAALLEKVPPPKDAKVRERVRAVQARLAEAKALQRSGKYRDSLALAEPLLRQALELPYPPLRAEALLLSGKLRLNLGEYPESERELYRAVWAAEEGRDDLLKTEAWRELVYNVGLRQARYDEAHRLARHAEAALARAGGDRRARMVLLRTEGSLLALQGSYRPAIQKLEQARALAGEQPDYGILGNLGGAYRDMGDAGRAIPLFKNALEIAEAKVGPDHPNVAGLRFNLGISLNDLERPDEALTYLEMALRSRERLLGEDHPDVADTLMALGMNRLQRDQPAEALPFLRRALAIYDARTPGTPHGWAMAHYNLGEAARRLGRYEEALRHEREAIRCIEETLGPESDYLLSPLEALGALRLDQGRPELAIPPLERALALYERQPPSLARKSGNVRWLLERARQEARL